MFPSCGWALCHAPTQGSPLLNCEGFSDRPGHMQACRGRTLHQHCPGQGTPVFLAHPFTEGQFGALHSNAPGDSDSRLSVLPSLSQLAALSVGCDPSPWHTPAAVSGEWTWTKYANQHHRITRGVSGVVQGVEMPGHSDPGLPAGPHRRLRSAVREAPPEVTDQRAPEQRGAGQGAAGPAGPVLGPRCRLQTLQWLVRAQEGRHRTLAAPEPGCSTPVERGVQRRTAENGPRVHPTLE